jgi:hypothetical protein
MKSIIFADEDTDGMTAVRIMYNYLTSLGDEVKVLWQTWDIFGVRKEDIDRIMAEKPDKVFILDIGSDKEVLDNILPILQKDIPVTIFDNHPPELLLLGAVAYKEYQDLLATLRDTYPSLFVYHSTHDSCTAAICYDYAVKQKYVNPNNDLWAILGITGDVAKTNTESKPIFEYLKTKYPKLQRAIFFSSSYGTGFKWETLDMMAQILHVPRRMIFDEAPPICFRAMEEIEQNPKLVGTGWFYMYRASDQMVALRMAEREAAKMPKESVLHYYELPHIALERFKDTPNIHKILELNAEWRDTWKDVEDRGKNIVYDFDTYQVSLISHPWNLGSALASKRAGNTKKTHFTINDIPDKQIHVSGRGGKNATIHIGQVFKMCDPKILLGGGFKEAGSAKGMVNDVSEILDALTDGANRVLASK